MPGVMDLIWPGAFVVQSIHVVARLGIADVLGREPRTADELAETARVHAPSLKRVLRRWPPSASLPRTPRGASDIRS